MSVAILADHKIAVPIVRFVLIEVMHFGTERQWATQYVLSDNKML